MVGSYYHQLFQRNRKDLAAKMERVPVDSVVVRARKRVTSQAIDLARQNRTKVAGTLRRAVRRQRDSGL